MKLKICKIRSHCHVIKNIYHFFVEGEGERAIINTLKTDFQCIQAGKVDVFNVIQNKLNKNILMKLKPWNDCYISV